MVVELIAFPSRMERGVAALRFDEGGRTVGAGVVAKIIDNRVL